ncbi:ceramidase domain-containing protein [Methylomagnum sp.]
MTSNPDRKIQILLGLTALAVIGAFLVPAIPQNPAYHQFADQSARLGIPNFWNVATNLPFLFVGLAGIRELYHGRPVIVPTLWLAYLIFFGGVALVGPGSAYYHLSPDNDSLLWDRLPMTLAFMALLPIIVGEYIDPAAGRRLLRPLLVAGTGSVLYWHLSERLGQGDLRWYGLVQFLPMLLIPLIMLMFRSRFTGAAYLWAMLGAYAAAKLAEFLDGPIFRLLYPFSGHALKHLLAALGVYGFLLAIRRRSLV